MCCQAVLPLLSLYLTKLTIDAVTRGSAGNSFGQVVLLIILAGIIGIVTDICRSLTGLVTQAQFQLVTDYVQNLLHAKSIEVDLEDYENAQYYDALHQAQAEAPYRPTTIFNKLIQCGCRLGAIALLLLSLHWIIAAILLLAVLPVFFASSMRIKITANGWTKRYAHYFSSLLTNIAHAKEIRLFKLGELFQERFRLLRQQIRQERLTLARRPVPP